MIVSIKIPEGYTTDQIRSSMQLLQNDPNFKCLQDVVENNDMARMRAELENPNTPDTEIKALQYRLSVFKEFFRMASEIEKAMIPKEKKEEGIEDDPYHTADSLRK